MQIKSSLNNIWAIVSGSRPPFVMAETHTPQGADAQLSYAGQGKGAAGSGGNERAQKWPRTGGGGVKQRCSDSWWRGQWTARTSMGTRKVTADTQQEPEVPSLRRSGSPAASLGLCVALLSISNEERHIPGKRERQARPLLRWAATGETKACKSS